MHLHPLFKPLAQDLQTISSMCEQIESACVKGALDTQEKKGVLSCLKSLKVHSIHRTNH